MKSKEGAVEAAVFTLSAFCSSQECGTCPFGGKDGNGIEIPCMFKSAEPATWFPMVLEMDESTFSVACTAKNGETGARKGNTK